MKVSRSVRNTVVALCVALPLVLAPPAGAAEPEVGGYVDVTGASTATVFASVYPDGVATSVVVEYGLASSDFCMIDGADGKLITPAQNVVAGFDNVDLQFSLAGLAPPGTTYCARIVASNGIDLDAIDYLGQFDAGLPESYVLSSESTSASSITVTGEVNPNNQATTARVRWAPLVSDWCQTDGETGSPTISSASADAGTSNDLVEVTIVIGDGLTTGQRICFQVVATNGSGTSRPTDIGFITVGAPDVYDADVLGTSSTSAHLTGYLRTSGQPTMAHVEYAPLDSPFCDSDGETGSATSTSNQAVPAATTTQTVVTTISGLDPALTYCVIWVASNASAGPIRGIPSNFRAGGPDVTTLAATGIGATSATLNASVNPQGSETFVWFEFAPSSSEFCQSGGLVTFGDDSTNEVKIAAGVQSVPVGIVATGLEPSTSYCFRGDAFNDRSRTAGPLQSFTTIAAGSPGGGNPGGGNPGGGNPGGGTTTPPPSIAAQTTAPPLGPFDTLTAAKLQYDLKMRTVSFIAVVGKAGSKVRGVLTLKGKKVAEGTRTGGPGPVLVKLTLNAKARKALKKKKLAKFALTVTVTPPGGAAITKKASFSLKRAKDPCLVTRKSSTGRARAAC